MSVKFKPRRRCAFCPHAICNLWWRQRNQNTDDIVVERVGWTKRGTLVKVHSVTTAGHGTASNSDLPMPSQGVSVTQLLIVRDVARSQQFYESIFDAKLLMKGPRSSRQGRKSGKVKVLSPSIACIRRIAYPVRAEVTKHVLPGSRSLSCPAKFAAVGAIWETSKLGGLNERIVR